MASKDLIARVGREAQRVAAACGVMEWEDKGDRNFQATHPPLIIEWEQSRRGLWYMAVHNNMIGRGVCSLVRAGRERSWILNRHEVLPEAENFIVRAMYRLGIDTIDQRGRQEPLPQLTAYEKLELRLYLPREFWPKTWLDCDF